MARISVGVDLRGLPPSVTVKRRLAGVARLTQAAQVGEIVGAAVLLGITWWTFLRQRVPTVCQAVLAERVGGDVDSADLAPPGTVTAVDHRGTLPLAVVLILRLRMLLAEKVVGGFGQLGWEHRRAGLNVGAEWRGTLELPLSQGVRCSTLLGRIHRRLGLTGLEDSTRSAVQPPVHPPTH